MSPRCLVVHPGALGDVLLAGPALAHLRALGYRPTLAVTSRLVDLFAASGLADDARDLESLALHRVFVEPPDPATLRTLASFDALVCWIGAGDPVFRRSVTDLGRRAVVARAAPPSGAGRHASWHLVDTLASLGPLPAALPSARLRPSEADRAVAEAWLLARGIRPGEAVILQPGAGSAVKVWPGMADLAQRMRAARRPLVALAGPADGSVVDALLTDGSLDEASLARDWPLPRIAALFALARVAVGNDSGPTHLAAAVGCQTVAVFGPTDPAVWAPIGPHVRVVAGEGDRAWASVPRVEEALRALVSETAGSAGNDPAPAGVGAAWR